MKKYALLLIILAFAAILPAAGFRENTVTWLSAHHVSPFWTIIIISMLPVIELRGAIPVGMFLFHYNWIQAALISILGNMLPIPFVLLGWEYLSRLLRKSHTGVRFTDWIYNRTRKKSGILEKYQAMGLAIFVGIPLPGTGAWTGAMAAHFMGMNFWKSMWYIFIGVLLAAAAVALLCQAGVIILT